MAYCPKCQGEMKKMDAICAHCGYDFPEDNPFQKHGGAWLFAPWTNLILDVAQIVAGLGCILGILAIVSGRIVEGIAMASLLAALVIIIGRVKYVEPR
jgi:hypothetical protein